MHKGSILLVVHQADSDPGLVGQLLKRMGYQLDQRCPAAGDPLPATLDAHESAIIFGGPMSANDDDALPFIRAELDWISLVLESNKPYLGICLGAQLLARVLGATVRPHHNEIREIGYFPINPTPAGQRHFGSPMHVYHWHSEGFELPDGATLLAEGHVFPNQAFCYGDRAYGIQFHPEITDALIEKWTTKAGDQLVLPGAQPKTAHLQGHERYSASVRHWLWQFLHQWLPDQQNRSVPCLCQDDIELAS